MNILIACEESQEVCKAFRAKGHNAFSCDIQPPSGGHPEWHIQSDVLSILHPVRSEREDGGIDFLPIIFKTLDNQSHVIGRWDMLIGFPPCTYLSKAGACNIPRHPERIRQGEEAAAFFKMLYYANIEHICIENPIPQKRFNLPRPSMRLQPYEYGHPYTKYTYLWLKNLPPLLPTCYAMDKSHFKSWCKVNESGVKDRAKNRSKTFEGVALAMAAQWGGDV